MSVVGALVKRREMSWRWTQRHLEISLLGRALARFEISQENTWWCFCLPRKSKRYLADFPESRVSSLSSRSAASERCSPRFRMPPGKAHFDWLRATRRIRLPRRQITVARVFKLNSHLSLLCIFDAPAYRAMLNITKHANTKP